MTDTARRGEMATREKMVALGGETTSTTTNAARKSGHFQRGKGVRGNLEQVIGERREGASHPGEGGLRP